MAKSNLSWSMKVDGSNNITGSKMVVEILATKEKMIFDLASIFKNFMTFTQCQMRVVGNGIKQKLADDLARSADERLTPQEMKVELKSLWNRLIEGKWFKPGTSKSTMKKRVDNAVTSATPEELAVLKKLGLI